MRLSPFSFCPVLLAGLLGATGAVAGQRGVVNGLTLTTATARVGTTITATVTGINPCGAVLVDWGDGTAVTHPIVELPTTHAHAYASAGRYRVTARGQGNCDGEAAAAVRIDAPPAPPTPARLSAFSVASPGSVGTPVSMTLEGEGTCAVQIRFGDGNTQELSVPLPHTFRHVYSETRAYNVVAAAMPPCEGGRHTARLEVGRRATAPRIGGLAVTTTPSGPRGTTIIEVAGSGTCAYVLDYGDGNDERRTAALPDRVRHVFPATGSFIVAATAEPPCEGRAQATLTLTQPSAGPSVDRVVVSPSPAVVRSRVSIRIEGRGTCPVTVDFGDGNEESVDAALPVRLFHTYARPGRYEVFAWTESPCTGDASSTVEIRR